MSSYIPNQDIGDRTSNPDWRTRGYYPLLPPALLRAEIPLAARHLQTAVTGRDQVVSALNGTDPHHRLLVFVGPCTIHDAAAALEFSDLLKAAQKKYADDLLIFMRCNVENPRNGRAWNGFINDPNADNTFQINKGIRIARQLFVDILEKGVPIAAEILDFIYPVFLAELVSVGEVGPRATENELHRRLASGLPFPVAFRNGSEGFVGISVDAIRASRRPQNFLSTTAQGLTAIAEAAGNEDCLLVLAGYYNAGDIEEVKTKLEKAGCRKQFMLDCGHGNSVDEYEKQVEFAATLVSSGDLAILGVVMKSNINEGSQLLPPEGKAALKYGISISDSCLGWPDTETALRKLAQAVKRRRLILSGAEPAETTVSNVPSREDDNETAVALSAQAVSSMANDGFIQSGEKLILDDVDANGWLKTTLGELTSPRTRSFFERRKPRQSSDLGELWTQDGFETIFDVALDRPTSIKVQALNPKALDSLSRPTRRELLEKLAGHRASICVVNPKGDFICAERPLPGTEWRSDVSLASMMAIAVALRGNSRLFSELVGLAVPETMRELQIFCQPPFLTVKDIPYLVHATARRIAHQHHGRGSDPSVSASRMGDIVAFLIGHTDNVDDNQRKDLGNLFQTMLSNPNWTDDRDRGIQVGLTMGGIRKYVLQGKDDLSKRIKIGKIILDTVFGGLTGVPVAGMIPAALQATAGAGFNHIADKKLQKWEDLRDHFNKLYHSVIDAPVTLDGFVGIQDESENVTMVRIDATVFKEWVNTMLEWNGGKI